MAGSGGGGGRAFTPAYEINDRLEQETRVVMQQMGGAQPSESEWDMFFMRSSGAMVTEMHNKIQSAHNVAKARSYKVDKDIGT